MIVLPAKPKFKTPCNGCGKCCALQICPVGEIAFPHAVAPCPALKITPDRSRTYCELAAFESYAIEKSLIAEPLIHRALGIDNGCTMEDDND